jgi:hypothetical protein
MDRFGVSTSTRHSHCEPLKNIGIMAPTKAAYMDIVLMEIIDLCLAVMIIRCAIFITFTHPNPPKLRSLSCRHVSHLTYALCTLNIPSS